MSRILKLLGLLTLVTAISSGCVSRDAWHGGVVQGFGGYWYQLPYPKEDFRRVGNHGIYWKTKNWELLVDESEIIFFDGVRIGQMQRGDELTITWEGQVLLNGEEQKVGGISDR